MTVIKVVWTDALAPHISTHIPFKASDGDASRRSGPSQADKQPGALRTGKERRSDLRLTIHEREKRQNTAAAGRIIKKVKLKEFKHGPKGLGM